MKSKSNGKSFISIILAGLILISMILSSTPVIAAESSQLQELENVETYVNPSGLIVKNATPENPEWTLPMLVYLKSSEYPGEWVGNHVKYIKDDSENGWRLAFCTELSKHFIDSTEYIGQTWEENGMHSEISYAITHGCAKYLDLNDSAYSTGDWLKDYYVTQAVIYCILSDYGFDGHSLESLSPVSGYQDVYDCTQAMYQDVKSNAGKDGYGDNPIYEIQEPLSLNMKLSEDKKSYESSWYSIRTSGELQDAEIYLDGAPEATEIVYEQPGELTSRFYLRIPVEDTYKLEKDSYEFKVKSKAYFNRPFIYFYESQIADAQNITFVEKAVPSKSIDSSANVTLELAKCNVSIRKTDAMTDEPIAGAIYGVYSDEDCKDLIVTMPETNANGESSVSIKKTQDTVYLKEITAAEGYVVDTSSYNVNLILKDNSYKEVTDYEQLGSLTIYKKGEVLSTVEDADPGVKFIYEEQKLKGAIFNVYAAEEIKKATGKVIYNKGDLVAENIITDETGQVTLEGLHLGSYLVKEVSAPTNYLNDSEEKIIEISYEDQDKEVVFKDVTFTNRRQKAEVLVSKTIDDTDLPLKDAAFGLYAAKDIKRYDGTILVETDTLIEQEITDAEGKIIFEADLPIDASYYVKEIKAPSGFAISDEKKEFEFKYGDPEKEKIIYDLKFENKPIKVETSKKDITGSDEVPGAKLTVLDNREQVIESWTSTDQPHYIEKLPVGEYILREESAPKGYIVAEDIKFQVKDTGEIQQVVMKDDMAKGKIILDKKDSTSGKALKGVEYELRDSNGNVLETLKTDDAGHAESKQYDIATFKEGKYSEPIKYVLVETKPLKGYELDPKEYEVIFEYVDDNTPVIELKYDLVNEKEIEKPREYGIGTPKTGDTNNILLPVVLSVVSATAAMFIIIKKKKRKGNM